MLFKGRRVPENVGANRICEFMYCRVQEPDRLHFESEVCGIKRLAPGGAHDARKVVSRDQELRVDEGDFVLGTLRIRASDAPEHDIVWREVAVHQFLFPEHIENAAQHVRDRTCSKSVRVPSDCPDERRHRKLQSFQDHDDVCSRSNCRRC